MGPTPNTVHVIRRRTRGVNERKRATENQRCRYARVVEEYRGVVEQETEGEKEVSKF
jgi:hypothetical protein